MRTFFLLLHVLAPSAVTEFPGAAPAPVARPASTPLGGSAPFELGAFRSRPPRRPLGLGTGLEPLGGVDPGRRRADWSRTAQEPVACELTRLAGSPAAARSLGLSTVPGCAGITRQGGTAPAERPPPAPRALRLSRRISLSAGYHAAGEDEPLGALAGFAPGCRQRVSLSASWKLTPRLTVRAGVGHYWLGDRSSSVLGSLRTERVFAGLALAIAL